MDLSRPFLPDREIEVPAQVLAAIVATARSGSETARVQATLDAAPRDAAPAADRFAPACGSFDAAVAAALWRWRRE